MAQDDNLSNEDRQRRDIAALLGKPMPPVSSQKQPQQPNTSAPASAPSPAPATPAETSSTPAPTAAAAPTTPAATSEPLREDQVKLAVKFLSSPKVQSADHSKKLAFLKQKGLTQAEIDEAFKRTSGTATSAPTSAAPAATSTASAASAPTTSQAQPASNVPPLIPPRPPVTTPTKIMYYSYADPERLTIKRIVAIALLVGTSAVGLTAGLVSLVKCYMIPVFKRIAGYQRGRYEEHHDHYKQLEAQTVDATKPWSRVTDEQDALVARIDELRARVQKEADRRDDATLGQLKNAVLDFKDVMNRPDLSAFNMPYSMYGSTFVNRGLPGMGGNDHPAVQSFKSEIRSFKGMLLSRRNFPSAKSVAPVPSVSSPGALAGSKPSAPLSTTAIATPTTAAAASDTTNKPSVFHPRQQQPSYRDELKATKEAAEAIKKEEQSAAPLAENADKNLPVASESPSIVAAAAAEASTGPASKSTTIEEVKEA